MNKATVTSVTAFAGSREKRDDLDADFSPIPFIVDQLVKPATYSQFSEELRLAGETPDLFGWGYGVSFVTGFFLFDSQLHDLRSVPGRRPRRGRGVLKSPRRPTRRPRGAAATAPPARIFGALAPPLGQPARCAEPGARRRRSANRYPPPSASTSTRRAPRISASSSTRCCRRSVDHRRPAFRLRIQERRRLQPHQQSADSG
jgi:hypothetical protein